ncbi:PREDICTED: caspase-9 isoform X1 [Condylura cristata]|uniref:caspase-9 isoform X1 n=1 Tax=Condylura cristata TaxID=143302 RepID=UPI0003347779|nr:PREDICTED: caspase-9 isoform X1 [Condylura cristata]
MDEAHRQVLRRCRLQLVRELQVDLLWDHLLDRDLFTRDMIEDIQRAGSGSRRDQARQLITDLETRGSRALPLFISCLEDAGQDALASLMRTSCQTAKQDLEVIRPLDIEPAVLSPRDLRPVVSRPIDISPPGFSNVQQKDHGFSVASVPHKDRAPEDDSESDAAPFQDGLGPFDQTDAVASLPTPSDIFVSYSTFPGFVSWRDTNSGSWYVETLDRVLEQWAHSEDLQTLLLRVADAVSEKGVFKQMPGCFNFLRKKLFFKT